MKKSILRKIFAALIIFISLSSCSNASSKKVNVGPDESYYLGLKNLAKGNEKEARVQFNRAVKKGSPLVARRSAEVLCTIGDVQEKISGAKKLLLVYTDEEALLTACRIFYENDEVGLVLQNTSGLNVVDAGDELVSIRFRAMKKRGIQGLKDQIASWYLQKPLSKFHDAFFQEFSGTELFPEETPETFLIDFREQVFRKNFQAAFEMISNLETDFSGERKIYPLLTEQLASDIGKTHLYGSGDLLHSARFFQSLAQENQADSLAFYWWFYAGRMYDKIKGYTSKTIVSYEKAIDCTYNLQKKDNARWYLLKASLESSVENCIEDVKNHITAFADPSYYDDFFDLLAPLLLNQGYYEEIGNLYKMMKGYASQESVAKFAYIYARLLQEKIYRPGEKVLAGLSLDDEIHRALISASDSGTDMYYKVMAAKVLNLSDSECEKVWNSPRKAAGEKINEEADRLLSGYAAFGFPEKIYPEWIRLGQCLISEESTINICNFLMKCAETGNGRDDYYPQSLRIASRYANYSVEPVSRKLLACSFPKCYGDLISAYAEKYGIEPEVFFALIRSESFFDADIQSSAGAVGLCQLMTFTADDVSRRLKKTDYDLLDPETNIEFGAWYLGNLIGRLDGNYLDAFYSYNAGITRVRKWKQSSAFGFGLKEIPEDLFLETLPYAETREYGRKLVSATTMYHWLY